MLSSFVSMSASYAFRLVFAIKCCDEWLYRHHAKQCLDHPMVSKPEEASKMTSLVLD